MTDYKKAIIKLLEEYGNILEIISLKDKVELK